MHKEHHNKSRLSLSPEQVTQFDTQGFVVLEQVFNQQKILELRQFADNVEQKAMSMLKNEQVNSDFVFSNTFFGSFVNRLLHFHLHGGIDSLKYLGEPRILAAIESLCGADFVSTVDMMIFKHADDFAKIPWHQDLIYPNDQYRVATAGIYLDDSPEQSGALRLIPGSQSAKQDICEIIKNPPDNVIEVNVSAGDVLIHNPMAVHSSESMQTDGKRRTLYYEFRPMAQAVNEETWPMHLLERRINLLHTAIDLYRQKYPEAEQFQWQIDDKWTERKHFKQLDSLYLEPIPFNTVNYCKETG